MKENAVRESVHNQLLKILLCSGKINLANIFTKEDKNKTHFIELRDLMIHDPPSLLDNVSPTTLDDKGGNKKQTN